MRTVFFAALLKLLSLEKGLAGPAFHPAARLITAAVSPPFRGIAQARAEFKLALLGRVKLLPHLNTFLPGCSCSNLLRPSTSKRKSALVRSLSIGPTEVDNPDFEDKLRNLDAQTALVEAQIARVEAAIQAAEGKANAATDTTERDNWREKEKQLREKEKEKQLREKKKQLREKKKQLREEKSDLTKLALLGGTAGTVAPAPPTPKLLSLPPGPELHRDYLEDEKERNARIVYRRFKTSFKGPYFPAPYERVRAVSEREDMIQRNLEQIDGALASHRKHDRQSWYLLVVPQSRGGGKTTALDELRFQLLKRDPRTVAIPVTFNGFTHLDQDMNLFALLQQHPAMDTFYDRVQAAFFARIAFAVLDHEQGTYAEFMSRHLVPFMRAKLSSTNGGGFGWYSLFRSLYRTASAERDKIVFLIDEIAMLERVDQRTSLTSLLKQICFTCTSTLPAVPAVVVSTLDLAPFESDFKTSTRQSAQLLELPSTFVPGNLLEQGHWFYALDQQMKSPTEKALLRTLIGILCSWPRGLEWLHLELNRAGAEETTLRALLQYALFKEIDGQGYRPNRFPDGGTLAVWQTHTIWIGLCPCSFEDRVAIPTMLDAQAKDTEGASVASLYAHKVLDGTVQYHPEVPELFLHQPSLSIIALNSLAGRGQSPRDEAEGVSGPSAARLAKMVLQLLRDRAVSILREELEGGLRISVFLEDLMTQWIRLLLQCRYDARAYLSSDDPTTPSWAKEALTPARLFPAEDSYSVSPSGNLVQATHSDERFADFGIPLLPIKYVELSAPVQADTERLSSDEQEPAWSQLRAMGPGFVWVVRCCDPKDEGSQGCDDLICWCVEGGGLRMVLRDAKAAPAPPGLGRAGGSVATRPQDPDALRRKIANGAEMAARFREKLADSYGNDVRCCQVVVSMGTRCSSFEVDHRPSVPCFVSFVDSTMAHFGPMANLVGLLSQRVPQV